MTAAERSERSDAADELCAQAFEAAECPDVGVALVAVGGFGRRELAPYSDLDLVLVCDEDIALGEWASKLWYPLWDSGANIDHSVRSVSEMLEQSSADPRVALGLLDLRHLAGDPNLTLRLRSAVLAAWRQGARSRLPELRSLVNDRADLMGELAHSSVPDLKESTGGLRDATILKGLVATWLVDVPHADLERCRLALLDVRDALHAAAGRATDRVAPEYWSQIAETLGLADETAAQMHTRALGRRMTHISRLTWRRVEGVIRQGSAGVRPRMPRLEPVAPGIAISADEVVLTASAQPARDPTLILRAAAIASERGLVLAPATVARLVRDCSPLPVPWPEEARDCLVRLLASGRSLLDTWETLDETGAIDRFLPEWVRVRLLPHASVVHRFTVDRHQVETCIEASSLIRRVARPDVLMVAALLHDIGKGGMIEHSIVGAPIARAIAERMGFEATEVELIANLVRWHLLLPEAATTRDPEDPQTVQLVTQHVKNREELELLAALTEADAKATSVKAWTTWRASMVTTLVRRTAAALNDIELVEPAPPIVDVPRNLRKDPNAAVVEVFEEGGASRVRVVSGDRLGLLADAAAMLALQKVSVRGARVWTQGGKNPVGVSEWVVDEQGLDAAVLRQRLEAISQGRLDPSDRLQRPAPARREPIVVHHLEASLTATVIEVRADDRPGLIYTVCRSLAELGISVRSAHVATLGPQAVDVFYVQEAGIDAAQPLEPARSALAVTRVLDSLMATVAS